MKVSQVLRNKLFWGLDLISLGPIRKNIRDIREGVEQYSTPKSVARRAELLSRLLRHARETTTFYRTYKDSLSIEDFPVVNKNLIRAQHDAFRSDKYQEKDCIPVLTSGSTGSPLMVYQNKEKKIRNTADTIYFAGRANYRVGHRLYYVRLWNSIHPKGRLLARLQNLEMVNVLDLSDGYFEKLVSTWQKDRSEKVLMGYVSSFTQLCKYLDRIESPPLDCRISSIIAVAETLTSYCKHSMEKYFKAPVVSRYSNTENGILAQQSPGENADFTINWSSYHIEIFDLEKDVPVEIGALGRIVITDLFNYAMPMIRYDTGDVGFIECNEQGVPVLRNIQGRKMDMLYDTKGRVLTPSVVWQLDNYKNIRQFQLVQNSQKSYTIRLNVDENFESAGQIVQEFSRYFGDDAEILIERTDEIPVLASGKRRLVVNNFQIQDRSVH
ncbi:MAG TPA: hypothetical protein VGE15_06085 [Sphingobacteriaceae bacterium]